MELRSVGILVVACCRLVAQDSSPATRAEFEVASIRQNTDGNQNQNIGMAGPGRFRVNNVPVRFMIRFAYNVQDFQISGGPGWMNTDGYDVNAKLPANVRFEQARPYLQSLLEERFQFVFHRETRDVPVFELLPAKAGLKIGPPKNGSCLVFDPKNPPRPGQPLPNFCGNIGVRSNVIEAYSVPMERFVATLSSVLKRTVIDKSGVTGLVDVHLEFTPEEVNPGAAADFAAAPAAADLQNHQSSTPFRSNSD